MCLWRWLTVAVLGLVLFGAGPGESPRAPSPIEPARSAARAVAANGKTIRTQPSDRTVTRWDLATGEELGRSDEPAGARVASLAVSGRFSVRAHDGHGAANEAGKTDLPAPALGAYLAVFTPDERLLATAEKPLPPRCRSAPTASALDPVRPPGATTVLRVWDMATGKPLRRWEAAGSVTAAVFSTDGRSLVTATQEGVTVWEVASGRERLRYKVEAAVLAYWPKGRVLAAVNGSDVVLLDLRADKEPGRLRGRAADVRSLAFTADGLLFVTGEDGTALIWDGILSPSPDEPREGGHYDLWAEVAAASAKPQATQPRQPAGM